MSTDLVLLVNQMEGGDPFELGSAIDADITEST